MDAGLVVVLAVLAVFLLVPLAFAWVSTSPRRWARVEGVLGREPVGREPPRWCFWLWGGLISFQVLISLPRAVRGPDRMLGVAGLLSAMSVFALFVIALALRRGRRKEASVQAQIQDRAEPGRPGAGG